MGIARTDAAFARLEDRLDAHFGAGAVLRGITPCVARRSDNVELLGEYGQVVQRVTTFTLDVAHDPKVGDTLQYGTELWTLDTALEGDGRRIEFTAVRARP